MVFELCKNSCAVVIIAIVITVGYLVLVDDGRALWERNIFQISYHTEYIRHEERRLREVKRLKDTKIDKQHVQLTLYILNSRPRNLA